MTRERRKLSQGGRKHVPLPQGPHQVGCVDIMTGLSKNGCFIRLFYPAQQPAGIKNPERLWPPWLPHDKYLNGYSQFMGVWKPVFKTLFHITVGTVYIPALWDADPVPGTQFPVIVFSHGLASCRTSYTTICMELASHGYVVAAVEHRDNSACHSYYMKEPQPSFKPGTCNAREGPGSCESSVQPGENQSGEVSSAPIREWVHYKNISIKKKEYPIRNKQVKQRAKECIRALDLLESLNNGYTVENVLDPLFRVDRFKDTMDLSSAAIAGHSFGGATVILSLSLELRFKLGLALDCWMLPLYKDDDVMSMVSQPILFVNMEKFQTKENLQAMSKILAEDVERKIVTIKGTVHLNQSDMPFICGPLTNLVLSGFSTVNRFTAIDLTTRLMLNFLGKYLDKPVEEDWSQYLGKHEKKLKDGISPKILSIPDSP